MCLLDLHSVSFYTLYLYYLVTSHTSPSQLSKDHAYLHPIRVLLSFIYFQNRISSVACLYFCCVTLVFYLGVEGLIVRLTVLFEVYF
jgi:hypothetical protein